MTMFSARMQRALTPKWTFSCKAATMRTRWEASSLTRLPPAGPEPVVGAAGHPGEDLAHGVDHVDHGGLVARQVVEAPDTEAVLQELTP